MGQEKETLLKSAYCNLMHCTSLCLWCAKPSFFYHIHLLLSQTALWGVFFVSLSLIGDLISIQFLFPWSSSLSWPFTLPWNIYFTIWSSFFLHDQTICWLLTLYSNHIHSSSICIWFSLPILQCNFLITPKLLHSTYFRVLWTQLTFPLPSNKLSRSMLLYTENFLSTNIKLNTCVCPYTK